MSHECATPLTYLDLPSQHVSKDFSAQPTCPRPARPSCQHSRLRISWRRPPASTHLDLCSPAAISLCFLGAACIASTCLAQLQSTCISGFLAISLCLRISQRRPPACRCKAKLQLPASEDFLAPRTCLDLQSRPRPLASSVVFGVTHADVMWC